MFGNIPTQPLNSEKRELLRLFDQLGAEDRRSLLDYLQFLVQRAAPLETPQDAAPAEPLDLPRPSEESVVAAIKRLSRTYYMVERDSLLNDTSMLMSAHMLQGRPASDVIDELEALFETRYREHLESYSTESDAED